MLPDNSVRDSSLWHRYQQGDTVALGQLMAEHYSTLLHYGTRFTRDTDCIRDCIQDVFVELWNRRKNLRLLTDEQVKPYLMTMLRRLLHAHYLDQQRFTFTNITEETSPALTSLSPEYELIDDEARAGNAHRIRELLEKLPARAREAVHLRFFDNLDRQAVAQIMGISEQSVSNLLQNAFRFLRQHATAEQFWFVLMPLFMV
jgi:RNA polymerase sigma factor (sigma-70 family)